MDWILLSIVSVGQRIVQFNNPSRLVYSIYINKSICHVYYGMPLEEATTDLTDIFIRNCEYDGILKKC